MESVGALNDKSSTPAQASRKEAILVIALLLIVIITNLATCLDFPEVWFDEAAYTDPAANLVMGNGFTSTALYQPPDRFWASNVPLHELILSEWIRVFGFSPLAVRSINYVWFALGTFLLWRFCVHFRLVESTGLRILFIVLLAAGSGVSFSYRSGRPDMICYFLTALALYAATLSKSSLRYLLLLGVGFFFPWAGLQLLPFLLIATALVFFFFGFRTALNGVSVGLGACIGLLGLYVLYQSHHVWHDFVFSAAGHASGKIDKSYHHAQISMIPAVLMRDRSAPLLLILGVLLLVRAWQFNDRPLIKLVLFGLAAGIFIPIGMHFAGTFPIYYGWMAAVPVCLVLCHALSRLELRSTPLKCAVIVLLSSAIIIGLPARLTVNLLQTDRQPYSALEDFISKQITRSDVAYANYPAFYPMKTTAEKVFFPVNLQYAMTPEEKKSVTVLVVDPDSLPGITNSFPGDWKMTAKFNDSTGHSLLPAFLQRHIGAGTRKTVYMAYGIAIYRKADDINGQTTH